jgi:hypothetical protein
MVSYDGRVFMCCIDWGNEHPIGYVSDDYFEKGDLDYKEVLKNAESGKKGFELMDLKMPRRYVDPIRSVRGLREIWSGSEIGRVREKHVCGQLEDVEVCKKCTFKDTYAWEEFA